MFRARAERRRFGMGLRIQARIASGTASLDRIHARARTQPVCVSGFGVPTMMHDSDNSGGRKTEPSFWAWEAPVRLRLPSTLRIDVLNTTRLLKKHVRPGDRYVEIGCAPG